MKNQSQKCSIYPEMCRTAKQCPHAAQSSNPKILCSYIALPSPETLILKSRGRKLELFNRKW